MPFIYCYIWAFKEKKDNDFENDDVDIEVL